MKSNSIGIRIEGTGAEIRLLNMEQWPNRGEFKRIGHTRKFYLYNGDKELVETSVVQGQLPDAFGLRFKRVAETHVDFKSKVQSITAIFTTYDILNSIEIMHEFRGYDE
jgi:hypothetical protein